MSFFSKREEEHFDIAVRQLLHTINEIGPEDPDYQTKIEQLDKLTRIKNRSKKSILGRISPDTLAIVVGNLVVTVIIVGYERGNVLTSKALNHTLKNNPN